MEKEQKRYKELLAKMEVEEKQLLKIQQEDSERRSQLKLAEKDRWEASEGNLFNILYFRFTRH